MGQAPMARVHAALHTHPMRQFAWLILLAGCGGSATDIPSSADVGPRPMDGGAFEDAGQATDAGPDDVIPPTVVRDDVTEDTTWSGEVEMRGRVFVTATLTIEPGTTVRTANDEDFDWAWLIIQRTGRLIARGTAEAPIVFTPLDEDAEPGAWGGVTLLGNARVNDGWCVDDPDPSTDACEAPGWYEGSTEAIELGDERSHYGGTDDSHSCGELEYVRIVRGGHEWAPEPELDALSFWGCGSGTRVSYVQSHGVRDDAVAVHGGTVSMDHVVVSSFGDDGFDYDRGWRGNVQFLLVDHGSVSVGDNAIEADNRSDDSLREPRADANFSNVTVIGHGEQRAAAVRRGARGSFQGLLVVDARPPDLGAQRVDLSAEWPAHLRFEQSIFWNVGPFPEELGPDDDDGGFDEAAAFADVTLGNRFDLDPELHGYVPHATEDVRPTPTFNENAPVGFGEPTADYPGAFALRGPDWTAGWTDFTDYWE